MSLRNFARGIAPFLSAFLITGCESASDTQWELQNPAEFFQKELTRSVASSSTTRLRFGGEAIDFGRLMRDGRVDFALVTPSMTRLDLLNFDLSALISPEFDRITVAGQSIDLPSNISLPEQTENYSIITIRLNKPEFRTFVKEPGTYTFSALRGQFPVKQVIDELRSNKSVFDIMNHFNFLGSGQVEAKVTSSMDGQNISVNQYRFDQADVTVKGPSLEKGHMAFSLSLSEVNGKLSPVDLKRLRPGLPQRLKVSPLGNPFVLSAMVEEGTQGEMPEFDKLSLTLLPNSYSEQPDFLAYTQTPQHAGEVLNVYPPNLTSHQDAIAIYVSFSEIRKVTSGSVDTEEKTILWENWTSGFSNSISTASLSYTKRPDRTYRFEVLYLAKDVRVPTSGTEAVDQVTHIARNILEVQ